MHPTVPELMVTDRPILCQRVAKAKLLQAADSIGKHVTLALLLSSLVG